MSVKNSGRGRSGSGSTAKQRKKKRRLKKNDYPLGAPSLFPAPF